MQDTLIFRVGDKVRHENRPEWGIGQIQRADTITVGGKKAQRLLVRFSNAGLKTISSVGAPIVVFEAAGHPASDAPDEDTLLDREAKSESGWLGEISKAKPEDAMVQLPAEATDPFVPLRARLKTTLDLFRFEPSGRSLVDWAVARSGLDDPLSRFTRQELEQYFERWSFLRQKHLCKLVHEAKSEPDVLKALIASALPGARRAVTRCNGER